MANREKNSAMVGLVAETNIHVGIGQSVGALDLPVARERITDYPFIPGSGVKGAFRVWAKERAGLDIDDLFGPDIEALRDKGGDGDAGKILLSDARLLLLPVRSLSSAYKWVTCPLILDRFRRDAVRAGIDTPKFKTPGVERECYLGGSAQEGDLALEEREFKRKGGAPCDVITAIESIDPQKEFAGRLAEQLVLLHDDDFVWFARHALPVLARNALDDKKIVKPGALWHEESLPPDTVMYLVMGERVGGKLAAVTEAISGRNVYIQMGGNETVGQGWFKMALVTGSRSAS